MIKLLNTVKLPLKICKGTYQERLSLAKQLNATFFENISKKYLTKEISIDIFEKTLKESTPTKIDVTVNNYWTKGGKTSFMLNETGNAIKGFIISLEKNPYRKGLAMLNTDITLHESAHYFSHLTNPKHTARVAKMYEKGLLDKTEQFYKENLYTKKDFQKEELSEKLDKFLTQFSPEEQINFLQNSRYRMIEEYNAFEQGYKYLDEIQDRHPDLICEKIYAGEKEVYKFPEKIKIVAEKLKQVISEYRKI